MASDRASRLAPRLTIASLIALMLLEALWSVVLAPLPSARWLWVKAVPLAILLPPVMRGARKPRQWIALLAPLYFAEALVRALTEAGRYGVVAGMAAALSLVLFVAVVAWLREDSLRG
ncbi:MAG: DUF2069 domain-containing protein [Burkholderiales bacterium]